MLIRLIRWFTAGLVLLITGYGAAGMVGGAIPTNRDWREPARGVTIYVESNGIHTGLIVPKVAGGVDWRALADPRDLADPRYGAYDHLAIGWGDRRFFLDTPTWRDLRPSTILAAAIGSDATLLHIEHLPAPEVTGRDVRRIVMTVAQYRRLAIFIRAHLSPRARHYPGYAAYDAFYDARGHYDAVRTCNDWTGDALRHAGVRIGAWTPFPVTVMGWFGV